MIQYPVRTMNDFIYISENTIQHLSLHDCCCKKMYWKETTLILDMEWMEVLASHPDNPFEKAHQSGAGRIVLYDTVIVSGELINDDNSLPMDKINEVKDFEILDFDETINDEKYELSLFGDSVYEPKADFIKMNIKYSSSQVMFNEPGEISWFESDEFLHSVSQQ